MRLCQAAHIFVPMLPDCFHNVCCGVALETKLINSNDVTGTSMNRQTIERMFGFLNELTISLDLTHEIQFVIAVFTCMMFIYIYNNIAVSDFLKCVQCCMLQLHWIMLHFFLVKGRTRHCCPNGDEIILKCEMYMYLIEAFSNSVNIEMGWKKNLHG